jgi:hypothetical protein
MRDVYAVNLLRGTYLLGKWSSLQPETRSILAIMERLQPKYQDRIEFIHQDVSFLGNLIKSLPVYHLLQYNSTVDQIEGMYLDENELDKFLQKNLSKLGVRPRSDGGSSTTVRSVGIYASESDRVGPYNAMRDHLNNFNSRRDPDFASSR